jgi:uncharacterized membrane protein
MISFQFIFENTICKRKTIETEKKENNLLDQASMLLNEQVRVCVSVCKYQSYVQELIGTFAILICLLMFISNQATTGIR